MNFVDWRSAVVALVALAPTSALGAGDAIARYDDAIVSTQVMDECHIQILGRTSEDKMRQTGMAAFQVLWENLDRQDSSSHEQNGKLADFLLKKRTELDLKMGHQLVAERGCKALTRRARRVLQTYLDSDG